MIQVYHMTGDWTSDERWAVSSFVPSEKADATALMMFVAGRYRHVASVDCDRLDDAYHLTQNIDSSWSMEPDQTVTVQSSLHFIEGRTFGLKSSEVGDIFVHGQDIYLCAGVGFRRIGETGDRSDA